MYLSKASRTMAEAAPLPERESAGSTERESLPKMNFAGRGQMNGRDLWGCGCGILAPRA